MSKPTSPQRSASPNPSAARNSQISIHNALRPPTAPRPGVVAGHVLSGGPVSFVDFVSQPAFRAFQDVLFDNTGTAAGMMLEEFRRARKTFYFGRAGLLTRPASKTRKLLKQFAGRAYRGDPDRRGVMFWQRVAWLLWETYQALMALRRRAEKIKQQEINRLHRLPTKRQARAAYMRRYRHKRRAKGHLKSGAKQSWRARRLSKTL